MSILEHTDRFSAVIGDGRGAGEGSRPDPLGLARFSIHQSQLLLPEGAPADDLIERLRKRAAQVEAEVNLLAAASESGWTLTACR